jgi:poly(3-hydroxybutyrate) depolymerase
MKRFSKAFAIQLSLALVFSLAPGNHFTSVAEAKSINASVNQEGVAKELPKPEDITINRDDYNRQVLNGYYNYNCYVKENVTRTAKFYVSSNSIINQPTVTIVVPSGVNTWRFLVDSGWKKTADKEGIFIVLAEPDASGKWGSISDESAYLTELSADVAVRPYFCSFEAAIYAIGYGDGARILQENALSKPNRFAGIGLIGAPGLSASKVNTLQSSESTQQGVKLSQVQLPAWIVSDSKTDDVNRLVDYFKSANHSNISSIATDTEFADELYAPQAGGNVDEEWCAKVYYDTGSWKDYLNNGFTGTIFKQLFSGVRRYPGNGVNFLRSFTDIYKAGFKKFNGYVAGGYEQDGSDKYNREWFVYEPKSVKPNKPAPVVFVFHGAGGSGDEISDRSGWKKVADKYGIILVLPTGSHILDPRNVSNMWTTEYMRAMWNTGAATKDRPSDIKFVEYLYNWTKENYNIDTTRVYAGGQSSGGAMSWAVTLNLPKIFAATMPVSAGMTGPFSMDTSKADTSSIVPVIHFIGEKDPAFKNGFDDAAGKTLIDYWTNRYQTVEKYNSYKYLLNGQQSTSKTGFFNNYVFNTPDGVPLLRAVEVSTSVHAIWPSESFTAWEQFFTKYTKDSTGKLYYNSNLVEIK